MHRGVAVLHDLTRLGSGAAALHAESESLALNRHYVVLAIPPHHVATLEDGRKAFHRKTTGVALTCWKYRWIRSMSSCADGRLFSIRRPKDEPMVVAIVLLEPFFLQCVST